MRKKIYNELSDCDNESLYITIAPTLHEKAANLVFADEDLVDHVPNKIPRHVVEVIFVLIVLLLVLIVVKSNVIILVVEVMVGRNIL